MPWCRTKGKCHALGNAARNDQAQANGTRTERGGTRRDEFYRRRDSYRLYVPFLAFSCLFPSLLVFHLRVDGFSVSFLCLFHLRDMTHHRAEIYRLYGKTEKASINHPQDDIDGSCCMGALSSSIRRILTRPHTIV